MTKIELYNAMVRLAAECNRSLSSVNIAEGKDALQTPWALSMNILSSLCFVYEIENNDTELMRQQMKFLWATGKLQFEGV